VGDGTVKEYRKYLRPRYQNDIVRVLEQEFVPMSPATRLPEDQYRSKAGGLLLQPHQRRILNHAFTPVRIPGSRKYQLPYDTIVYSCPKKSGKTQILTGLHVAWALAGYGGEQYSMANSREQSRDRAFARVGMYADWLRRTDLEKYSTVFTGHEADRITFRSPYSSIQTVPVAPGSQAGGFQSLTGWDELWSYERETALRLFAEMQPIPTIPDVTLPEGLGFIHGGKTIASPSLRIITTYSGYHGEAPLLWAIYESVCKPDPDTEEENGTRVEGLEDLPVYISDDKRTLCYWDHECRMPWQTEEFIEQARNDPINRMRPEEFRRLWENRWTSGNESFIDMNLWDQAAARGAEKGLYNAYP
jgi:hypothetical protein